MELLEHQKDMWKRDCFAMLSQRQTKFYFRFVLYIPSYNNIMGFKNVVMGAQVIFSA